jgi:prophage tail gpP-like protein
MPDNVTLRVAGHDLSNWLSYRIPLDMYVAAGEFNFELGMIDFPIPEAAPCQVYVNGQLELTGIIDKVQPSYDKQGEKLTITGRSLMGLVVDSYCEEFITLSGMKLSDLATRLLKDIPYINRAAIIGEDVVGKLRRHKKGNGAHSVLELFDKPQALTQIQVGMTKFHVLKEYSMSRGLMFYERPDGTFVFGKPKSGGEPVFTLTNRRDGFGNNIISGSLTKDASRRFSKITVIGQQQGQDIMAMDATKVQTKATLSDPTFPFNKPLVTKNNNDYQSPALHAQMLLEKMKHEGFALEYKVARHSQNGVNWTFNEMCRVVDQARQFGLDGAYLIYGRCFQMDKRGQFTTLRLGVPGVVA